MVMTAVVAISAVSAALIAHLEAAYDGDAKKNALSDVVPVPNTDRDFFRFTDSAIQVEPIRFLQPNVA